jgi:hypothetical protein
VKVEGQKALEYSASSLAKNTVSHKKKNEAGGVKYEQSVNQTRGCRVLHTILSLAIFL